MQKKINHKDESREAYRDKFCCKRSSGRLSVSGAPYPVPPPSLSLIRPKLVVCPHARLARCPTTQEELRREGFDPRAAGDAVLVRDPGGRGYVALTPELLNRIKAGTVRL